jgi:hypothetical protein
LCPTACVSAESWQNDRLRPCKLLPYMSDSIPILWEPARELAISASTRSEMQFLFSILNNFSDSVVANRKPNCYNRKGLEPFVCVQPICPKKKKRVGPRKPHTKPPTNRLPHSLHVTGYAYYPTIICIIFVLEYCDVIVLKYHYLHHVFFS